MLSFPDKTADALVLQAQGYRDHEVGKRVGLSAAAVRQRLSRVGRGLHSVTVLDEQQL
jgi:predicted transcriptional regulator